MKINFFSNNFNQCRFIIFFDKGFCNLKGGEKKNQFWILRNHICIPDSSLLQIYLEKFNEIHFKLYLIFYFSTKDYKRFCHAK